MLDLKNDYDSYLFGLILADGNMSFDTRNRGKVRIELSYDDKDIIEKIYNKFYYKSTISFRERNTNFKDGYKSVVWTCHEITLRENLLDQGFPEKNKTKLGKVPIGEYREGAFWRGYIDGDGSIGMTKNNEPFISFTISSKKLKEEYLKFLERKFNVIKILKPNKRDNVYNVTVKNEDAIALGDYIYNEASIKMDRKYNKYLEIKKWKRSKKKINVRTWTPKEDEFILNNCLADSMIKLNRSKSSINMRLWRLKQNNKIL